MKKNMFHVGDVVYKPDSSQGVVLICEILSLENGCATISYTDETDTITGLVFGLSLDYLYKTKEEAMQVIKNDMRCYKDWRQSLLAEAKTRLTEKRNVV